jgi:hypothetical protein
MEMGVSERVASTLPDASAAEAFFYRQRGWKPLNPPGDLRGAELFIKLCEDFVGFFQSFL